MLSWPATGMTCISTTRGLCVWACSSMDRVLQGQGSWGAEPCVGRTKARRCRPGAVLGAQAGMRAVVRCGATQQVQSAPRGHGAQGEWALAGDSGRADERHVCLASGNHGWAGLSTASDELVNAPLREKYRR